MTPACERVMGALGQGKLPADLAAHAASCPHCQPAVAAYRALAPGGAAPPPRAPSLSAALEAELAVTAGKPAPSALRGPLLIAALQAAIAAGTLGVLAKGQWIRNQASPAVLVTLAAVLAAVAIGGTLAGVLPGLRRLRAGLFAAGALTAAVLGACGTGLPGRRGFVVDGAVCGSVELGCAVLPLVAVLWLQRRFAFEPLRAAVASLAAAATGVFALHLHCPIGTASHLYVFHVLPWVVVGALGLWIRSRLRSTSYAP